MVVNHPSWWDPLIGVILTGGLPEWRAHFGPIEMSGLEQYRFLERLGFFGIEVGTARGSLRFLRVSQAILSQPESILWITAQGEFVDARIRPVVLKDGIGHLAHRLKGVIVVPMALEYPFWNDRCPEALVRFGPAINVENGRERSPADWRSTIERRLQECQDMLAAEALARDAEAFVTVLGGTAGIGGIYDLWRRFRSALRGRRFKPEHAVRPSSSRPDDSSGSTSRLDPVSTQHP